MVCEAVLAALEWLLTAYNSALGLATVRLQRYAVDRVAISAAFLAGIVLIAVVLSVASSSMGAVARFHHQSALVD
eukprot:5480058-Amphidinium_carterae.1